MYLCSWKALLQTDTIPQTIRMNVSFQTVAVYLILFVLFHTPSIHAWTFLPSILASRSSHSRHRNGISPLFSSSPLTKHMIEFSKYEGLGNDFILIDNRSETQPSLTPQQAIQLCNRNFGIGADGVIFALAPPSSEYDFTMRIFNSDGSEPEMCGNGIRCFAAFLRDKGETSKASLEVSTKAGKIIPIFNTDGTITVDMGSPILEGPRIPTTLTPNADQNSIVEQTLLCNNKEFKVTCVSMGNPHCVIFVQDLQKDIDFVNDGPALEKHTVFPAKTNVEFVQVLSDRHLKMKVWERGAGPTLACGTGACTFIYIYLFI